MADAFVFLRGFLQNPLQVSSVFPTSKRVVGRLAATVREGRSVIVEYGPGTGVLTRALLRSGRLSADSKIILIEKSGTLVSHLRSTFTDSRVHIFHRSAEDVAEVLLACGESSVDYIFTSIPFSMMSRSVVDHILRASKSVLSPGGSFITFLFHPFVYRFIRRHFPVVCTRFELINFPPLFIFHAKKEAAHFKAASFDTA